MHTGYFRHPGGTTATARFPFLGETRQADSRASLRSGTSSRFQDLGAANLPPDGSAKTSPAVSRPLARLFARLRRTHPKRNLALFAHCDNSPQMNEKCHS